MEFLPAVLTCFLISTAYSSVQPSCSLITDLVAKETVHTVTMVTTSDWKSTDLCVCRLLSTPHDSTYLTFDLLGPSGKDSDAICGPYLTVEPISGSFYHVCPRSQSSRHGSTISNQSSITVALWSRDPRDSLLGANITFHSYMPITLTCRKVVNSFSNLENVDCPCEVQDFSSPRSLGQSDFDLSTRLMQGFVVSFSFLFVCGLLLLFFRLNKRFNFTERLKQKIPQCRSPAAKSATQCGSGNSAFETSNSYDELPATVNAQSIDDLTYEKIRQPPNASQTPNKGPEMEPASKNLNGSVTSGIYEEIPYGKLRDVSRAALGDTYSLCPYAATSEVRDAKVRAHLVGMGALSAGDICRWKYSPPSVDHVMKRSVKKPFEWSRKEPEAEVVYGTVNKLKAKSGNGIPAESSTLKQDDLSSSRLGQQDNDTFV